MSAVGLCLGLAVVVASLAALAVLALPGRLRPAAAGTGTALAGAAGLVSGAAAMGGRSFSLDLPVLLPLSGLEFAADRLAALQLGYRIGLVLEMLRLSDPGPGGPGA